MSPLDSRPLFKTRSVTGPDRSGITLGENHSSLDRKAYAALKSMIVRRLLKPGQKIGQQKLASDLGISRTPLTNALKLLEQEHLVVSIPRRGYIVRTFGSSEMIEIFEMRQVLEGLAARRAAEDPSPGQIGKLRTFAESFSRAAGMSDTRTYAQVDRSFHAFIIETGAKPLLKQVLETHNIIMSTYQIDSNEGLVRPPHATLDEHLDVIEAICMRRPESAEQAMRTHLGNSIAVIRVKTSGSSSATEPSTE